MGHVHSEEKRKWVYVHICNPEGEDDLASVYGQIRLKINEKRKSEGLDGLLSIDPVRHDGTEDGEKVLEDKPYLFLKKIYEIKNLNGLGVISVWKSARHSRAFRESGLHDILKDLIPKAELALGAVSRRRF